MSNVDKPDTEINLDGGIGAAQEEKVTYVGNSPQDIAAGLASGVDVPTAELFLAKLGLDQVLCTLKVGSGPKGLRGPGMLKAAQARNLNKEAVYYHLNTVRAGVNKKALRVDITHINAVGIDVDWGWKENAGNFQAAHAAVLLKAEALKALSCQPSVIVSTGGGVQAFWILPEPLEAGEFEARAVALGKTLKEKFGGDAVHSIDHVFRLPGFTNHPNENKRGAGQPPALVTVIFESDHRHTIGELETAFTHAGGGVAPEGKKTAVASPELFLGPQPESFRSGPLPNGGVAGTGNDMSANIGVPDMNELASLAAALKGKLDDRDGWFGFSNPMANLAARFPLLHGEIFKIYDETCTKSLGYDKDAVKKKFDELVDYAHGRMAAGEPMVGIPELIKLAEKHGWTGYTDDAAGGAGAGGGTGAGGGAAGTGAGGTAPFVGHVLNLQRNKHGHPFVNWANARKALQWGGVCPWRDTFSNKIYIAGNVVPPGYLGILKDEAIIWARGWIYLNCGFDPGIKNTLEAMLSIAEDNLKNPVIDTLADLVWDGKKKMETWLPRITGCVDTPLHRGVGQMLLLAMVVRARFPGTKYDTCVVLEGTQGIGKSTLARELAGGATYFTDATNLLTLPAKERGELLAGCWVAELPELGGLRKSAVETVKQVMSQQDDNYRRAYGHFAGKQPRTCVFLATTNDTKYLEDMTGSRRFVPVKCIKIDNTLFKGMRDQLFAEANDMVNKVVAFAETQGHHCVAGQELPIEVLRLTRLGEKLWSAVAAAGEDRRVISHEEMVLEEWQRDYLADPKALKNLNGKFFIPSLDLHGKFPVRPGGRVPHTRTVAALMRKLGWEGDIRGNNAKGGRCRGYEKI
jgi:Virulence-associated protein E/RepB DNA-primase from phage plasmid